MSLVWLIVTLADADWENEAGFSKDWSASRIFILIVLQKSKRSIFYGYWLNIIEIKVSMKYTKQ